MTERRSLRIPTPRDGWRAFAGEVGVIVLGVLIALAAQQVAEAFTMRGRVAEFRKAVDREMAGDLWYFDARRKQLACDSTQLKALGDWLAQSRDGQVTQIIGLRSPVTFSLDRSVWDNRDADVFAAMSARDRLLYAQFYDTLANLTMLQTRSRDGWSNLRQFEVKGPLSTADRRLLHQSLGTLARTTAALENNIKTQFTIARDLRIAMRPPVWVTPAEERRTARDIAPCPQIVVETGS